MQIYVNCPHCEWAVDIERDLDLLEEEFGVLQCPWCDTRFNYRKAKHATKTAFERARSRRAGDDQ